MHALFVHEDAGCSATGPVGGVGAHAQEDAHRKWDMGELRSQSSGAVTPL